MLLLVIIGVARSPFIREACMPRFPVFIRWFLITTLLVCGNGAAAQEARQPGVLYPVKFLCGPSSESFQEGMVNGVAQTAVNVLNPSAEREVRFEKRVARALPYQTAGPVSPVQQDAIQPMSAIEIECNEIRQMLPSQMTEEFRTGYLMLRAEAELIVTVVYSARPRDGEISTLDVQRVAAVETDDGGGGGSGAPDLVIAEIDMDNLRNRCPSGQGSCIAEVPVTVANIGDADAGPFRVRISFDPGQSTLVFRDLPGLEAGGTQTFQAITQPADNCFDPNCQICAVADFDETVAESNEGNNELCRERQG